MSQPVLQPVFVISIALVIATMALCVPAHTASSNESLEQLMSWISGDFDNGAQVNDNAQALDARGDPLFSHLGLQRRWVSAPLLGDYVLYAQINRRADPGDMYRQTVQVFSQDEGGQIRAANYRFAEPERHADILANPSRFAELSMDDVVLALPPGCEPSWRFSGGAWVSRIERGACVMISRRDGKPRHIQSTEFVQHDAIRNEESGYNEKGEQIFGLLDGVFYNYVRRSPLQQPAIVLGTPRQ